MGKMVRVKVTKQQATELKKNAFFRHVLKVLVAERNALDRKIARLKKKLPQATLENIEAAAKQDSDRKLREALALVGRTVWNMQQKGGAT